jgi:hypothetical protein
VVNVRLSFVPQLTWNFDDVGNQADCSERTVEKQGEETSLMLLIMKRRRGFLWTHEDQECLTKVSRNVLEGIGVVRVYDEEEGFPRKGIQVSWIQTMGILELSDGSGFCPFILSEARVGDDSSKVIAVIFRVFYVGKNSIRRQV